MVEKPGNRDRITQVLQEHPGGVSVTAIVDATGLSRSAVSKNLAALEAEGRARRTTHIPETGRRQADTWHPATPPPVPDAAPDSSVREPGNAEVPLAPESPFGGLNEDSGDAPDGSTPGVLPVGLPDVADSGEAPDTQAADAAPAAAEPAAEVEPASSPTSGEPLDGRNAPEPVFSEPVPAPEPVEPGNVSEGGQEHPPTAGPRLNPKSGTTRAAPGELRAMVATHLAEYPGAEFTAGEIAKVLGRSPGAIQNALVKLAATGEATLTCQAPRRYQAA